MEMKEIAIARDGAGDKIYKLGEFRNHSVLSFLSGEMISLEFRKIKDVSTMRMLAGRLSSNGFEKVYEEKPELQNLEERNGSFPILSGKQIWVMKQFVGLQHVAYVKEQYCNSKSYTSTIHIRIKGPAEDVSDIAYQLNR